jgi:Competence protein CoiA-like family
MKYKYSLNRDGLIIDVEHLERDKLDKSNNFTCISCGRELIPKLGKKRKKHFSHKTLGECSNESYLHKLGKLVFLSEYNNCIKTNNGFFVKLYEQIEITQCQDLIEERCYNYILREYNLIDYFPSINLEKRTDGFQPDLTLCQSKNNTKIFIEIVVNHKCSEEKLNSGNRIIEIYLDSERDLDCILQHRLDSNDSSIKLYNFNSAQKKTDVCTKATCTIEHDWFVLLKNQKCFMKTESASDFKQYKLKNDYNINFFLKRKASYSALVKSYVFPDCVVMAYKKGNNFKNCYLCRYHASGYDSSIFCKWLKKSCNSLEAIKCNYFRIDNYLQKVV